MPRLIVIIVYHLYLSYLRTYEECFKLCLNRALDERCVTGK